MMKKTIYGIMMLSCFACAKTDKDQPATAVKKTDNLVENFKKTSYYEAKDPNENNMIIKEYNKYHQEGLATEKALRVVPLNQANYMFEVLTNSKYCLVDESKEWDDIKTVLTKEVTLQTSQLAGAPAVSIQDIYTAAQQVSQAVSQIQVAVGKQLVVADYEVKSTTSQTVTFVVNVAEAMITDDFDPNAYDFQLNWYWCRDKDHPEREGTCGITTGNPRGKIYHGGDEIIQSHLRYYFRHQPGNVCVNKKYSANVCTYVVNPVTTKPLYEPPLGEGVYLYRDNMHLTCVDGATIKHWYDYVKSKIIATGAQQDRYYYGGGWPDGQKIGFYVGPSNLPAAGNKYAMYVTVYYQNSYCDQGLTPCC